MIYWHHMDTTRLEKLLEENIRLLQVQQKRERRQTFFRMLGYLIAIALLYWGYTQIKPYFGAIQNSYEQVTKAFEEIQEAKDKLAQK